MGLLISELNKGSSFNGTDLIAIEQDFKTVSISLDQLKGEVFASYNAVDNIANYSISTTKLERISPNTLLGNVSDSNNRPTEVNIISDVSLGNENNIPSGAAVKDAIDNATIELEPIIPKTVLGNLENDVAVPGPISILEDLNDSPLPATIPSSSGVKNYVDAAIDSSLFPPIDNEDFAISTEYTDSLQRLVLSDGHPEWNSAGAVNISNTTIGATSKDYNSLLTVQGNPPRLNSGPNGYTNPASLSFKAAIYNGDQSSDVDSGGLFIGTKDNNNDEYAIYLWDEHAQKHTFGIKASTGDVEVFGRHSIILDEKLISSTQVIGDVLSKLRNITPIKYTMDSAYDNGSNFVYSDNVSRNSQYGFNISEFETQFPDLINYNPDSATPELYHYKGIDLIRYTSVLTKGIQELDTRINNISTEEYGHIIINNDWSSGTNYSPNRLFINWIDEKRDDYDPYGPVSFNSNFTREKEEIGLLITNDNPQTQGPGDVGICLYNDNPSPQAFSPMITFAKRESGTTDYKTATAAIYSRTVNGTMPNNDWIDGELIFATAGYDVDGTTDLQGLTQRMVIDSSGRVGINTNAPTEVLEVNGNIKCNDPTESTHVVTKSYIDNQSFNDIDGVSNSIASGTIYQGDNTVATSDAVKIYVDAKVSANQGVDGKTPLFSYDANTKILTITNVV